MPIDLVLSGTGTPFQAAYPWTAAAGFGVKYANPSVGIGVQTAAAQFSPDGTAVIFGFNLAASPFLVAYAWSLGSGFGAKYSNPATLPTKATNQCAFSHDGLTVAVPTYAGSFVPPLVLVYPWSSGSGFGAKYSDPASWPTVSGGAALIRGLNASFTTASLFLALSGGNTMAAVTGWPWGPGFGAKYSEPSSYTGSGGVIGYGLRTTAAGADLIVAPAISSSTPALSVFSLENYPISGSGFGAARTPAAGVSNDRLIESTTFTAGETAVAAAATILSGGVSTGAGALMAWPWTAGVGYGVKYAEVGIAAVLNSYAGLDAAASGAIAVGFGVSPYVQAYPFAAGFGAAYASPGILPTSQAYAVRFTGVESLPPSPGQPDDCGPLNLAPKPLTVLPPEPVVRTYPHVTEIPDWATQQSVKLLWDRVHQHESQIRAGVANDNQWVTAANAHGDKIITIETQAAAATLIVQPGGTPPDQGQPPLLTPPPATPPPATGGPGGSTTPSTNPPVSAADMIDLGAALIINAPDIRSNWAKTAAITQVTFGSGTTSVDFTRRDGDGRWPDVTPPGWSGPLQYTLWLFKFISGQWVGSAFIQFWHGRVGSGSPNQPDVPSRYHLNWYYAARWAPIFGSGAIASGEQIGFMVTSGNERDSVGPYSVQERSNVVLFAATDNGTYNF